MKSYEIMFPADFEEWEWEAEKKGWLAGVEVATSEARYLLVFYDAHRLSQDLEDELRTAPSFYEPNLVVVESVTRTNIVAAIDKVMAELGGEGLVPQR